MIREGRPADLPHLEAIQRRTLSDPWPDLLARAPEGPPVLLVAADPEPVGYALAIGDGTDAYLAEIAVAPERRREGHGSRLLTELCARLRAKGHETVRLTVRADEPGVQSFYREHGFEAVERIADHYGDGTDGLAMLRSLG